MSARFLSVIICAITLAFVVRPIPKAGERAGSVLLRPPTEPPPTAAGKLLTVIPSLNFEKTSAAVVLSHISQQADLNLAIDSRALEAEGIELLAPISLHLKQVTAGEALEVVEFLIGTPTAKLRHVAEGNLVFLADDSVFGRMNTTRIYDLSELIAGEDRRLAILHRVRRMPSDVGSASNPSSAKCREQFDVSVARLVADATLLDSWLESGGPGSICLHNGRLIITQTAQNHARIDFLLRALLESANPTSCTRSLNPDDLPSQTATKLKNSRIKLDFRKTPLSTVLASIREQANLNLITEGIDAAGFDPNVPMDVQLKEVSAAEGLDQVLKQASNQNGTLSFLAKGNLIMLGRSDRLSKPTPARIYDVVDLILAERKRSIQLRPTSTTNPSAPDGLENADTLASDMVTERIVTLIQETIAPETWPPSGGMIGSIQELDGRLIVTQTQDNHAQVERFLDELRKNGLPATRPTAGTD